METRTTKSNITRQIKEDLIYYDSLLSHVNYRLKSLTPGFNCTIEQYNNLIEEKISLTLSINKVKLRSRGYTFVENNTVTYTYNNLIFILGGIYSQRIRA